MENTNSHLDDKVKQEIIDYCLENRISVKAVADDACTDFVHAPISVTPSPFSKVAFDHVVKSQIQINALVHNLMSNIPLVRELLNDLGSKDEFVAGMLKISKEVEEYEHKQRGYFGILRSDYMYDEETHKPKMIEVNTIASSFGPLAWGVNQLHQHLVTKYNIPIELENLKKEKNPKENIITAFKQAHDLYCDFGIVEKSPIMIVIIGRNERNRNDMGDLVDGLHEKHGVVSKYCRFDQVLENSELKSGKLFYEGDEVAIVYFRFGYDSSQYTCDEDWQARKIIEISQAIKCPSMDLQLLTLKKIQEVLCDPKVWQVINGDALEDIRPFFNGMYGLHDLTNEETIAVIKDAKTNPDKYVLKTQREGGGHNYFGDQIPVQLEKEDELWKYSLMKRIFPVSFPATLLRDSQVWHGTSVNELGIFGKLLVKFGESHQILQDEEIG
jgi:glutathione synthetase